MTHLASILGLALLFIYVAASPFALGVYDIENAAPNIAYSSRVPTFERYTNTTLLTQVVYVTWAHTDAAIVNIISDVWSAGRIPVLVWDPVLDRPTDVTVLSSITDGMFDDRIESMFAALADFLADNRRLFFVPFHEMNGGHNFWSADREGVVAAYKYMFLRGRAVCSESRMQWVFSFVPDGVAPWRDFYPGMFYADWLAVSLFHIGGYPPYRPPPPPVLRKGYLGPITPWTSAREALNETMTDIERHEATKPVMVLAAGSTSVSGADDGCALKNAWLLDLLQAVGERDRIAIVNLYNQDAGVMDWGVFGGSVAPDCRVVVDSVEIYNDDHEYETYDSLQDVRSRIPAVVSLGHHEYRDHVFFGAVCWPGSFGYATPGNSRCRECYAGTYSPYSGMGACLMCPAGTYQDDPGQTGCKTCPAGRTTAHPGTMKDEYCVCDSNTMEEDGQCVSCRDGTYAKPGDIKCTGCPGATGGGAGAGKGCDCGSGTFDVITAKCISAAPSLLTVGWVVAAVMLLIA